MSDRGQGRSAASRGAGGWLRGIRFSWFTIIMMGLLVLGVLIIAPTLRLFVEQQHQITALEAKNATTKSQVGALSKEAARWSDPAYIRAQARDRLLYVMPGETSYLVIDDRPKVAASKQAPVSPHIQQTQNDWLSGLFSSFMSAGLSTAPADQLSPAGTGTSTPTSTPAPTPTNTPTR